MAKLRSYTDRAVTVVLTDTNSDGIVIVYKLLLLTVVMIV